MSDKSMTSRITWTAGHPTFTGSVGGIELFRGTWNASKDHPGEPWSMRTALPGRTFRTWRGADPAALREQAEGVLAGWLALVVGPEPDRDADLAAAMDDLADLHAAGALAGVAEILRERRRQIEVLNYAVTHDDSEHGDGWLVHFAVSRLQLAGRRVAEGSDGPEEVEEGCRQAGALAAAEIDRLIRMVKP
jgi:hypothetical protein